MTYPHNVQISRRMQVIDIDQVTIHGVLQAEYSAGWLLEEGKNIASLEEWLNNFNGKDVTITIKLTNPNDEGVKTEKKRMEPAP